MMDKLPLVRVAEVAFLAANVKKCVDFYERIGLRFPPGLERLNFANVGEQLFGVCEEKQGFFDGKGGFVGAKLHVAFEVPKDKLDECISFLRAKGVETSPKNEWQDDFHGVRRSASVYFKDPAGNIIELWAPSK